MIYPKHCIKSPIKRRTTKQICKLCRRKCEFAGCNQYAKPLKKSNNKRGNKRK